MKSTELKYNRMYKLKGQSSKIVAYKGQEGKRFWFADAHGSFWMNENQVETLLLDL